MSNLLAARAQMGTSLAFHIIFASLGSDCLCCCVLPKDWPCGAKIVAG
jgi:cytochrome bd-type quinol oxidase subunit 1